MEYLSSLERRAAASIDIRPCCPKRGLYDRVVIMESGVVPRWLNFVHRVVGAGEVVRGVWCRGPIDLEDQVPLRIAKISALFASKLPGRGYSRAPRLARPGILARRLNGLLVFPATCLVCSGL